MGKSGSLCTYVPRIMAGMPAVRKALVGFSQGALLGSESGLQVRGWRGIWIYFSYLRYVSSFFLGYRVLLSLRGGFEWKISWVEYGGGG